MGQTEEPSGVLSDRTISSMVCSIAPSPINVKELERELAIYPDTAAASFLLDGFKTGFSLNYEGPRVSSESKNIKSALEHPEIVLKKLEKELAAGRIAGPFVSPPFATLRVSPIGLVPKKEANDFRLIHHLSYPAGLSVNDYIDRKNCSVQYTSFDVAVHMVQDLGRHCLLFKLDVRSAFRLLPVAVSDFDQLGFKFDGKYYFDKCCPFGFSGSCKIWETFAKFLEFMVRQKANSQNLIHYLDDFLGGGKGGSDECFKLMDIFRKCMQQLSVPLSEEKTEGPCTVLVFLGLEIDSDEMVIRIPLPKVEEILLRIQEFLARKKVTLREMQSLIGVLNFACRAIVPGRPFCRRLINSICGLTKPYHHLRLNKGIRQDLLMWRHFFQNYNGVTVFHDRFWITNEDLELFTDSAAGQGLGFGIYFSGDWASAKWPQEWHDRGFTTDITLLELFPIYVALCIWGEKLRNKKVCFRSDNMAVVYIINSMTSKSDMIMVLLRNITLKCLQLNIAIKCRHVIGRCNLICDFLSRFQPDRFRQAAPDAAVEPVPVPDRLWNVFDQELLLS